MKKTPLFIALLLSSLALSSQEAGFYSFGIEINPWATKQIFDDPELGESARLVGASVAGNIYLNFSPRFSVKSGASLSLLRVSQSEFSIIFGCDYDGVGGLDIRNSWTETDISMLYVGIPLAARLSLSERASHPYLRVGGELRVHLGNRGETHIYECGTILRLQSPVPLLEPSALVIGAAGLGYELSLKSGRSFYLEPNVEYSVNQLFRKPEDLLGGGVVKNNSRVLNFALAAGLRF
jgi:hypothetical protein